MGSNSPRSERNRRTVVIADDEPSVRLLVHATIGNDDYNVVEACDGDEAWSMIQEHLTSTKVILLTASAQESDIAAGLVAGADFYLTKPFSPRDLLSRLDEALEL